MGTDRARETLRRLQHDITSGRWPIDSKIPTEAELAGEYGVGRSTIREATRSLANLGMLEPAAGRGTFVRSLNPVSGVLTEVAARHSWGDILAVRKALEVSAAELAARNGTEAGLQRLREAHRRDLDGRAAPTMAEGRTPGQFHAILMELAGNALLAEVYAGLVVVMRRGMQISDIVVAQDDAERHQDHGALLAAVEDHDPQAAARIAAAHADRDLGLR